jgi:N-acetylglutamate synthase-like GNAT family acetyltransferase
LTATDIEALEDALDTLSKDKKILVEKELDDLKEELAEYQEVRGCVIVENFKHI